MSRIREVFGVDKVVFPVVHPIGEAKALHCVEVAIEEAFGVLDPKKLRDLLLLVEEENVRLARSRMQPIGLPASVASDGATEDRSTRASSMNHGERVLWAVAFERILFDRRLLADFGDGGIDAAEYAGRVVRALRAVGDRGKYLLSDEYLSMVKDMLRGSK